MIESDLTPGFADAGRVLYAAYLVVTGAMLVLGVILTAALDWWERRQ